MALLYFAAFIRLVCGSTPPVVSVDLFRAMVGFQSDEFPTLDNDVADLGGVLKYIETELLTEHLADPLRKSRKYGIDSIRKQRYKIRNPDLLLKETADTDFGAFVTYDSGQATNTAQNVLFEKYGDFVGIQPQYDVRFGSEFPYNWFSVGNWCPNFAFAAKGPKGKPNKQCLKHNGRMVMGGLCPGGADTANPVPMVDPTGQDGCTYSYGKSDVLIIDDLVGITSENCAGGTKCKDWLHFRNNCTNEKYRSKFNFNGQPMKTSFCVEYDIHPQCEANCHTAPCQALIKSGALVELGLPFWKGRCDPQANVRRMEVMAASFHMPGALTEHVLVDEALLQEQITCTADGQGMPARCKPAPPGGSGPYCSRAYTGVCTPCHVPGTAFVAGSPPGEPSCPLDILSYKDYLDKTTIPPPKCKSTKASELCCLYTKTCEGDSNPATAPLDDDGLALVASRQNTPDMVTFLKRAGPAGLGDEAVLQRAAYYQWGITPRTRTLAQSKAEVTAFLLNPPTELHPSSSVAASMITTTQGMFCFTQSLSFSPSDMAGTMMSTTQSAWECQNLCSNFLGCEHFSYATMTKTCHLQDLLAVPQEGPLALGSIGGPARCWSDLDPVTQSKLIDLGHHTYVPMNLSCLELDATYGPWLGVPQYFHGLSALAATYKCQKLCADTNACAHFTYTAAVGTCQLAAAGATRMPSLGGTAAGPPTCADPGIIGGFSMLPGADDEAVSHSKLVSSAIFFMAGALVVLACAAVLVRTSRSAPTTADIAAPPQSSTMPAEFLRDERVEVPLLSFA